MSSYKAFNYRSGGGKIKDQIYKGRKNNEGGGEKWKHFSIYYERKH